jgi:hypothetical protein
MIRTVTALAIFPIVDPLVSILAKLREEALVEKPSWCRWLTLVVPWGASQHRQAQLMSLKQDFLFQPQKPASLTSQTGLESLGRYKHCYPSLWP